MEKHLELNKDKQTEEIKELAEVIEYEGGPLTIVGNKERGYFLAFGKYKLTKSMDTPTDIEVWAQQNRWKIIVGLFATMLEINESLSQTKNQ